MRIKKPTEKSNYAKFGLNEAVMTSFDIKSRQDGTSYVLIRFKVGTSSMSVLQGEVTKVWDKENKVWIEDKKVKEFQDAVDAQSEWFTQLLLAYISEDDLGKVFKKDDYTFKEFVTLIKKIMDKKAINKEPIHIFLQYEPRIRKGQDRTWLEIPDSLRFGNVFNKLLPGKWTEVKSDGLAYINEEGIYHPFRRSEWFMNSNFAKPQKADIPTSDDDEPFNATHEEDVIANDDDDMPF